MEQKRVMLQFKSGTEFTLKIEKKGQSIEGILLRNKCEINRYKSEWFKDKSFKDRAGEKIRVFLNGKTLSDEEGNVLIEYPQVFNSPKAADLYLVKGKNTAVIGIDDCRLAEIPVGYFDSELFKRRNHFKVRIMSDDNWYVIRYANLHQHTEYSLLDGMTRIKDLAEKSEYACAITDHGNMFGFLQFYNAMKAKGKKPIIGFEAYVETVDGSRKYFKSPSGQDDMTDAKMFDNVKETNTPYNGEHLILLAKDNTGLKNLYKLCTDAENHFYRKPHVTYEMLEKHHEGIIATSACIAGTLGQAVKTMLQLESAGQMEAQKEVYEANRLLAEHFIEKMISIFGKEDFYIELQNHHFPLEDMIMKRIRQYAKKYGLKTTIGIDAHYLNKEDAEAHQLWLCLQTGSKINDERRMEFSGDGYWVHNSEEVLQLFPDDAEALDNTLEIADKCNVTIEDEGYHLPHFPLPEGETEEYEYLKKLTWNGFEKFFKNTPAYNSPEYRERVEFELKTIHDMGWAAYFLIVSDFIAFAEEKDMKGNLEKYFPSNVFDHSRIPEEILNKPEIYVGSGRGSACGSLVCYCIGITKVDPIKYSLLFERFLNPERVSMPDIDSDFEDAGRATVRDYCMYKYGADKFSKVITFTTAGAKAAVKSVARVLDYPVAFGQKISDAIPKTPGTTIKEALEISSELRTLYEQPDSRKIIDYASKIEGLAMNKSVHACATCITDNPITDYMPEAYIFDKETGQYYWTAALQGSELESMGLLKMDFLGLRTLGVAHEAIRNIEEKRHKSFVYDEIPLTDLRVYNALRQGKTLSVFQSESDVFTDTLKKVFSDFDAQMERINKIKDNNEREKAKREFGEVCFNRLSDTNALVRPGPMEYIDTYVANMKNPDKICYDTQDEESVLRDTNGVMLYQEQMMILTRKLAGFSMGQSDMARKGCAKKKMDVLQKLKGWFISGSEEENVKGCIANGIDGKIAEKIWGDIEKFGSYAFNKSHAVAYSMHTARTAWLSCYYPIEYLSADLSSYIKKREQLETHLMGVRKQGITILPPDVNKSDVTFTPEGNAIRFGLAAIKKVGAGSEEIVKERKEYGEFTSYRNFVYRMSRHRSLKKDQLLSLIQSGALDALGETRKDMADNLEPILKYIKAVHSTNDGLFELMGDILGDSSVGEELTEFPFKRANAEYEKKELLNLEYESCGTYFSGNPLEEYDELLEEMKTVEISYLSSEKFFMSNRRKNDVILAGVVHSLEKKTAKKTKRTFYSFKLEDHSGTVSCLWFDPDLSMELDNGSVIFINGSVRFEDSSVTVFCNQANTLELYAKIHASEEIYCRESMETSFTPQDAANFRKMPRPCGKQSVLYVDLEGNKSYICRNVKLTVDDIQLLRRSFGYRNVDGRK